MKTKNVMLAVIAFVFAVGSAFASLFAPEDVIVRVKTSAAPGAPTICLNTGFECTDGGTSICTINFSNVVDVSNGTSASSNGSVNTRYSDCATALFANSVTSFTYTGQIQKLVLN